MRYDNTTIRRQGLCLVHGEDRWKMKYTPFSYSDRYGMRLQRLTLDVSQ